MLHLIQKIKQPPNARALTGPHALKQSIVAATLFADVSA